MNTDIKRHPEDIEDDEQSNPQKLRPNISRLGAFLGMAGFAAFWNGIIYFGFVGTDFKWSKLGAHLFLIPFMLIGVVLVVAAAYALLAMFNPKVIVALSSGAVPLGGDVEIAWEVEGKASRFKQLTLAVHATQHATYQRGTTTTTDTEIFERIPIAELTSREDIEFGSTTVTIPESTMHSFESDNNRITWTVEVKGKIPWWPDVKETFEFRVKPTTV